MPIIRGLPQAARVIALSYDGPRLDGEAVAASLVTMMCHGILRVDNYQGGYYSLVQ